jgi:putative ABC transport system permease protein
VGIRSVPRSVWWRIAWRNLWRNRRRTLLTASALAFGYLAAVLMVGVSDGMTAEMIRNGTGILTGQIAVNARGYRPERSLYATIGGDSGVDVPALLARIASTPGVVGAAPRVSAGGLVSLGEQAAGTALLGVEPAREAGVSRLLDTLERGRPPRPGATELVLGAELARKLRAAPGSVVVLVAPAADGSMGNALYTVTGIFRTGLPELDGGLTVLPLGVLQQLLALTPDRIHEVAVATADPWAAPAVARALAPALAATAPGAEALSWTAFRPELADYAQLAGAANGLIVAIVFAMAVFGVANTMVMGTYERRREFAVVRAIGTSPGGVARTVLYEGLILGCLALVAGALLTAPMLYWWHEAPPDLSALFGDFTTAGALIHPVLVVEYSVRAPILAAVALLVTAIIAALYPAVRAARVPPADALANR